MISLAAGRVPGCLLTNGVPMKSFAFLLAAAAAAIAAPASATVISFDDVGGNGAQVANGYNGLNWNNFGVLNKANLPVSGYAAGTVSGNFTAFNLFGTPASINSATDFTLNSFFLTAAWFDNLVVTVTGSNNGSQVFSQVLSPSATAPTLYSFGGALIDQLSFVSTGGTLHPGYNGSGTQFALENLTINESILAGVPEPASWAMMITGFGLAGIAARRRAKVTVSFA